MTKTEEHTIFEINGVKIVQLNDQFAETMPNFEVNKNQDNNKNPLYLTEKIFQPFFISNSTVIAFSNSLKRV
jgi:uncharacterized UBP type Zn finger protein